MPLLLMQILARQYLFFDVCVPTEPNVDEMLDILTFNDVFVIS